MEYGPNVIDSQVSNSDPYIVSATSEDSFNYGAWRLFDGDDASYWNSNGTCQAVIIKADFGLGNAKKIKKYLVKFYPVITNNPSDWTLEGSNDDSNWTVLDTQTGQAVYAGTTQSYEFSNAVAYRYYRLNVTDGASPSDAMCFYTLGMFEALYLPSPFPTFHRS